MASGGATRTNAARLIVVDRESGLISSIIGASTPVIRSIPAAEAWIGVDDGNRMALPWTKGVYLFRLAVKRVSGRCLSNATELYWMLSYGSCKVGRNLTSVAHLGTLYKSDIYQVYTCPIYLFHGDRLHLLSFPGLCQSVIFPDVEYAYRLFLRAQIVQVARGKIFSVQGIARRYSMDSVDAGGYVDTRSSYLDNRFAEKSKSAR